MEMEHVKVEEIDEFHMEAMSEMLFQSQKEGFRHIQRLLDEYKSGINKFTDTGEALFECRIEDRVVGICGLNRDPYFGGNTGRVRRLYVLPVFRGYGIGRKLTEAVINTAKQHFQMLVLKTDSPSAGDFYKRLGFEEVSNSDQATHRLKW